MEDQIVQKLKQNIPEPYKTDLAPVTDVPANNGQAEIAPAYELDEMVQYKLHDLFGTQYRPTDEVSKQRVQYIYETVSKTLEDPQYGFVAAKIREIERIAGITNSDDRIYRMYQWLKLENIRRTTESEMEALRG